MDANVITGPWAKREPSNVAPLRASFADLAALAGNFGDALDGRKSVDADDLIRLSEALDTIALRARNIGYALSKPSLLVVAQDAESLSERVMHEAARVGDKS